MTEDSGEVKVGLVQKIVFGVAMAAASTLFYLVFLNWVLMEPIQNLPYPY